MESQKREAHFRRPHFFFALIPPPPRPVGQTLSTTPGPRPHPQPWACTSHRCWTVPHFTHPSPGLHLHGTPHPHAYLRPHLFGCARGNPPHTCDHSHFALGGHVRTDVEGQGFERQTCDEQTFRKAASDPPRLVQAAPTRGIVWTSCGPKNMKSSHHKGGGGGGNNQHIRNTPIIGRR